MSSRARTKRIARAQCRPEPVEVLAELTSQGRHERWDDVAPTSRARPRKDVTDTHLLGLAERRGGRLVTFDRRLGRPAADPSLVEVLRP